MSNKQNEQDLQNVQRLESDVILRIYSPRMLGNLDKQKIDKILLEREILLKTNKYKGNTTENKAYKQLLPKQLLSTQFEWCVGLLLGDGTLQSNNNGTTFRIKMQQSEKNRSLLYANEKILPFWVFSGTSEIRQRKCGTFYREFQTITAEAFTSLVELFTDSAAQKVTKNACIKKNIPVIIAKHLTPIAIGAWYCGDGGRRDYGPNEGKAIQLHTQGFDIGSINRLVEALRVKYGWDCQAKFDYIDANGEKRTIIQIEAISFESFVEIVSPYILPHFRKRLPSPRNKR